MCGYPTFDCFDCEPLCFSFPTSAVPENPQPLKEVSQRCYTQEAAPPSRSDGVGGTYWVELVGALLLKGVVSGAVQRALGLPPPEGKGPKPLAEGRPRQLR